MRRPRSTLLLVSAVLLFACGKRDASSAARPDVAIAVPSPVPKEESPEEQAAREERQKKASLGRARTRAAALGLELADDGRMHRVAHATCDATIATPPCDPRGGGSCKTAAGCKERPHGACVEHFSSGLAGRAAAMQFAVLAAFGGADAAPTTITAPDAAAPVDAALSCACEYACASDSDCKKDEACLCGGDSLAQERGSDEHHSHCVKAFCRTDADCKGDGRCDLAEWDDGCSTVQLFACRTPRDTCTSAKDCRGEACGYADGRFQCLRRSCIN